MVHYHLMPVQWSIPKHCDNTPEELKHKEGSFKEEMTVITVFVGSSSLCLPMMYSSSAPPPPPPPPLIEQRAEAQEKVGQPFTLKRWQMLLWTTQTNIARKMSCMHITWPMHWMWRVQDAREITGKHNGKALQNKHNTQSNVWDFLILSAWQDGQTHHLCPFGSPFIDCSLSDSHTHTLKDKTTHSWQLFHLSATAAEAHCHHHGDRRPHHNNHWMETTMSRLFLLMSSSFPCTRLECDHLCM